MDDAMDFVYDVHYAYKYNIIRPIERIKLLPMNYLSKVFCVQHSMITQSIKTKKQL